MAFADAAFDGSATLEGCTARRADSLEEVKRLLVAREFIPLYLGPFPGLLEAARPLVLVDARMRKHSSAEAQRGLAALTIGLGPGFATGRTCDIAIETSWDGLGTVIMEGAPRALAGEPRELAGFARERYVYAPVDGVFHTKAQIGDAVTVGQEVATVGATPLRAPVAGVLRGVTHDGVPVATRTKVIEVDPRGRNAEVSGIAERPRRIAEGVLAAMASERGRSLLRRPLR
jgi:xanthine dehydrogenase accessory factor